ncbi:4'-phosphopantetheinyl transferase family protein [Glaciimonas sp. GG7]
MTQRNLEPDLHAHRQRIDLWCAFPAEIVDAALLEEYRCMLSEQERQHQQRFYFPKDRQRYLVTRALVRTVLSRYAPISPQQWIFSTNAYGKPYIANGAGLYDNLSFNISHSDNLIIIGITRDAALGLDTENSCTRGMSLNVVEYSFAPVEVADLQAQPLGLQQERFFAYWTLKESYIKARGMGLSIPLEQFSFHFPSEHAIDLTIDPVQNDDPARWRFWQFRIASDYLVAVCAETIETVPPLLVLKQSIPLRSEQDIDYELLRKK